MYITDKELVRSIVGARAEKASYLDLTELASAGEEELRRLFGDKGSSKFMAALELGRQALTVRPTRGSRVTCASDVFTHYRARLALLPVEEFWSLALDVRHRVISETMLSRGTLTGVDVHPRDVFRPLIRMGAAAAIFVHNHPSMDVTPSRQDIDLTSRLRQTGELCGIAVLDHVIVGCDGYSSMVDRGWA
jgi:DNA repair protein RadC